MKLISIQTGSNSLNVMKNDVRQLYQCFTSCLWGNYKGNFLNALNNERDLMTLYLDGKRKRKIWLCFLTIALLASYKGKKYPKYNISHGYCLQHLDFWKSYFWISFKTIVVTEVSKHMIDNGCEKPMLWNWPGMKLRKLEGDVGSRSLLWIYIHYAEKMQLAASG